MMDINLLSVPIAVGARLARPQINGTGKLLVATAFDWSASWPAKYSRVAFYILYILRSP